MWTLLICLLLIGDVVVGYCWWRERQAHRLSRNALHFWRRYHGQPTGAPTIVRASDLDTDHGMAAVREVLRAKVASHRASQGDAARGTRS